MARRSRCQGRSLGARSCSLTTDLLADVGRVESGEELAEEPAGEPTPGVGRSASGAGVWGVEWCRTCGSSGKCVQALPAPRGQLKQRVHRDGRRRADARPTCVLRCSLVGPPPLANAWHPAAPTPAPSSAGRPAGSSPTSRCACDNPGYGPESAPHAPRSSPAGRFVGRQRFIGKLPTPHGLFRSFPVARGAAA